MSWSQGSGDEAAVVMLVSAHPDDEGIFGGGTLCYYAQFLRLNTVEVQVAGTDTGRRTELQNAVRVYSGGQPGHPNRFGDDCFGNIALVTAGLADVPGPEGDPADPLASWTAWGNGDAAQGRTIAAHLVATAIRRYQPAVVASAHSLVGDYGHTNHTATAIAAIDGVAAAADASTELDGLPPWTVSKLYVRGDQEVNSTSVQWGSFRSTGGIGQLFHRGWETRVVSNRSSSYQITDRGLREHVSQYYLDPLVATVHCPPRNGPWAFIRRGQPSEQWTLYSSAVGADTTCPLVIDGDETTYSSGWSAGDFLEHTSIEAPTPVAAAPTGAGVNLSAAMFDGGSFEQSGCDTWLEFGTDGSTSRFTFVETSRTDDAVSMTDASRNTDVIVSLGTRWIQIRTRPSSEPDDGQPYQNVYPITDTEQVLLGRQVRSVRHATGSFQRSSDRNWVEVDDSEKVTWRFTETSRDRWIVELHDTRRAVDLRIDMQRRMILYRDGSNPFRDQYPITEAY